MIVIAKIANHEFFSRSYGWGQTMSSNLFPLSQVEKGRWKG
jgi:hypothetical protein